MDKRKMVIIDGIEIDVPADWSDEKIRQRHSELQHDVERLLAEVETTDHAAAGREIADDLEARGEAPDLVAFLRASAQATEIAALERSFGR